jgi:hypothetical protein
MRFKDDETTVAIEEPTPAASGPTKTVEQWATAKGYLPEFFMPPDRRVPAGVVAGQAGTVPINLAGLTGPRHNPNYGYFSAARVVGHWPEGKEMTEAEFDAAMKAAGEHLAR